MNSSHQTRYMYSSAKSVVLKHCSAITDWGMDIWVKDIRGYFFLIRHITWADLDGFIISICAHTPSLCPRLCSSFLCLFTHEMSHSQPSLTHICLLLVTSSFLNFSHSTSFRQPIFCCLLSLSLNFLLHYSFLTFGAASADETLPLRISVLFYPFQRWVIWEEWKKRGGRPLTPWPLQAGDQILLLCLWFIMGPIS